MKMRPSAKYLLSGIMMMAALAGPAFAQQSADPALSSAATSPIATTTSSLPAADDGKELGEIVVTAQRRAERLRDVPISIIAQSGADLARAGVTNTKELSVVVPGLSFTTQGAWAEPAIRGVQTTVSAASADSPIAIYMDGVYLSNQVANVFDLPDVQRIEVLKGPQGTLFGRNATGGAISIYSRDPEFTTTGNFSTSIGEFTGHNVKTSTETTVKGFLTTPLIDDVLAFSVAGFYDYIPGYMTNQVTGDSYGLVRSQLYRGKLLFRPSDNIKFVLSGSYGKRLDELNSTLTPIGGRSVASKYPDAIVPDQPWHTAGELAGGSHIYSKFYNITLRGEFTVPNAGTISSTTAYTHTDALLLIDADGAYSPICLAAFACLTPYVVYYSNRAFQQEVTFASNKLGIFSFIAGAFYYHDVYFNADQNVNPPITVGSDQLNPNGLGIFRINVRPTTTAYAGFGELSADVTRDLTLIAGLRYSDEERRQSQSLFAAPLVAYPINGSAIFHSVTPRVSLRYDLSPQANLYGTYSQGFKSGYIPQSAPTTLVQPEKITSYEVGTKIGTHNFNFNAAGFYYDYRDLQSQFFTGNGTIPQNANATIWGFDIDGTVKLGKLQLRAAGSYLPHANYSKYFNAPYFDAPQTPFGLTQYVKADASGSRLLKTPQFTGSLTATYATDIAAGRLEVSGTAYHSDGFNWDIVGRVRTQPYETYNAQVSLMTGRDKNVRVSLFAKNITNKAYITGTVLSAAADGAIYGAPREIGVSAGYSF